MTDIQKAIVIGCPGAGKSTFARKLRDLTGLPLYYLDQIFHKPDRTTVTQETFDAALEEILVRESWIIDGNYSRTLEKRLQACDTVFLLDLPLSECLQGAEARIGTVREDLPWVETEFDPEFRQWIEDFPREQMPRIRELLARYGEEKTVIVFHSRSESDGWIHERREKRIVPV